MGEHIPLRAPDGHHYHAYLATPDVEPAGGVVVLQEIYGVNRHIREVMEGFAADGYLAIAPALMDRIEPGVELGYDAEGAQRGRQLAFALDWPQPLQDIAAAVQHVARVGRVATVGYCWGGSLSYLAAARLDIACAVVYYGGQIARILDEDNSVAPRVPLLMHFGELDDKIPLSDVERMRGVSPAAEVYIYGAGHGFNCDLRPSYHAESAALARKRTLACLARHLDAAGGH
jgi:carboxymethylenebutenolidase